MCQTCILTREFVLAPTLRRPADRHVCRRDRPRSRHAGAPQILYAYDYILTAVIYINVLPCHYRADCRPPVYSLCLASPRLDAKECVRMCSDVDSKRRASHACAWIINKFFPSDANATTGHDTTTSKAHDDEQQHICDTQNHSTPRISFSIWHVYGRDECSRSRLWHFHYTLHNI